MKALIAGGGTGGHFYPGYAAALELKKRGWETLFFVKENDISIAALDAAHLPWTQTALCGFPRSLNPLAHAAFAWKLANALRIARNVIADWKPDIVIGTGGYISFPAVLAARLYGVPSLIHDSNAVFGLANRVCAKFATAIAAGLPVPGQNAVITGTPVRGEFANLPPRGEAAKIFGLDPQKKTVLVFGGSMGARAFNTAGIAAETALCARMPDLQFLHIAGKAGYPALAAQKLSANIKLLEYCGEMHAAFAAADLIVCRSGASTLAELIAAKKPSIQIPLPVVAAHQEDNGRVLERAGCAAVILESPNLSKDLEQAIARLISEPQSLQKMSDAFAASGLPDPLKAASAIAALAEKTAGEIRA